jgi:hypothetical protein
MLLYSPPFLMVGPVMVLPDHADLETFYYLVSVPQLVRQDGEPAFWATAILPPSGVGSSAAGEQAVGRVLVSFDVHLPLPDDPEDLLRREIQKRWGREARRLVPAPLSGGKVTLTVARPGASEASKEIFVYEGHAPALLGDNRAALAIAAEQAEAQALVAAMSVGHLAGVLSYELEFAGLTPSFKAEMKVDWKKVYSRFRQHDTSNFIFYGEEIDKTVERLENHNDIDIEVQELTEEGAKAATRALFDELKSEVIKRLFASPLPTGETPIEERIGRGVREVLTSLMPGMSYSLRQLDQTMLVQDHIKLSEQQVRTYKLYPQSTLAGLLDRAGGAASRLTFVRVEDLPHRVEEVAVELAAGADRLGARAAEVQVRVTSAGRDEPLADQGLRVGPGERKLVRYRRLDTQEPTVQARFDLLLDPALAPGGRERWSSGWGEVVGNRLWIDPEEWLDKAEVRLEIDDPAVFDLARVGLELEAWLPGATAPLRRESLTFSKEAPAQSVLVVVPDDQRPQWKGQEVFRRAGELDFVRPIPALAGSVHRIMNPFGQAWSMEVRALASWPDTAALFAEFRVWDPLRRTWLLTERQFQKDSPNFTLRFSTSRETPRRAEARVTRVGNDGQIVRGPWQDLAGPVVSINDAVSARRRIRATLAVPHFAAAEVAKVLVDLDYRDLSHQVQETGLLELVADGAAADWLHTYPDPTRAFFRFRVRARSRNGQRHTGPWQESGADDLTITLPADPWAG